MSDPRLHYLICAHPDGLHRMAYWEWSPASTDTPAPTVICVHGLTRNGRDFDTLARRLCDDGWRVVCPDIVGRGRSDWLGEPHLYQVPQYVADCVTLIARLDVEEIAWVGTSMGGLIGMGLASLAGTPISRLLLNDVGPVLGAAGLARIKTYVGRDPRYPSFEAAERALREVMSTFGEHSDEEFRELSRFYFVQKGDAWGPHYDPAIGKALRDADGSRDRMLWPLWDAIRCPVRVLRGVDSDVLTPEVAAQMSRRGPKAEIVTFDGVGHAPTLIKDGQVDAVRAFLNA